jgi:hypothetical protein
MKKWAFILCFGFLACNVENRQKSKAQLYLFKHPEFSAGYCAEQFPDKADSVIVKTDTVTEIQFMDSIVFDTDTLYRDSLGFKYRTITKVVTKTITKDNIIYRENRAEQERLQLALLSANKNITDLIAKNTILEQDRNDWKGKARKRGWMFLGLIFLVVGAVGMRLYLKSKSIII